MKLSRLEAFVKVYNIMIADERFPLDVCSIILEEIIKMCREYGIDYFFKENGELIIN
jgi:hypothetical protein